MNTQSLVLALLEEKPLYGYLLVKRAQEKGKLHWEEGTLYPLLHRMEGQKLLSSEWKKSPQGKRRKYYAITRKGLTALAEARVKWKEQVKSVSSILLGGHHA